MVSGIIIHINQGSLLNMFPECDYHAGRSRTEAHCVFVSKRGVKEDSMASLFHIQQNSKPNQLCKMEWKSAGDCGIQLNLVGIQLKFPTLRWKHIGSEPAAGNPMMMAAVVWLLSLCLIVFFFFFLLCENFYQTSGDIVLLLFSCSIYSSSSYCGCTLFSLLGYLHVFTIGVQFTAYVGLSSESVHVTPMKLAGKGNWYKCGLMTRLLAVRQTIKILCF